MLRTMADEGPLQLTTLIHICSIFWAIQHGFGKRLAAIDERDTTVVEQVRISVASNGCLELTVDRPCIPVNSPTSLPSA
jgi:hypothetical protein